MGTRVSTRVSFLTVIELADGISALRDRTLRDPTPDVLRFALTCWRRIALNCVIYFDLLSVTLGLPK